MSVEVRIQRLQSHAKTPNVAHPGDAGADLFALEEVTLAPGERRQVRTGIALALPEGFVGLVWDKSGLSHKHGLKTLGGVIDSGYRGEVLVGVVNLGQADYTIEVGNKIAQLLIQRVEQATFTVVEVLGDTTRGTGGFGSTGM